MMLFFLVSVNENIDNITYQHLLFDQQQYNSLDLIMEKSRKWFIAERKYISAN